MLEEPTLLPDEVKEASADSDLKYFLVLFIFEQELAQQAKLGLELKQAKLMLHPFSFFLSACEVGQKLAPPIDGVDKSTEDLIFV